jgi:hypothetical protein
VSEVLSFLVVAAGLGAILSAFVWLARRVRRSGVGGGLMGPIDEIYRPTAQYVRHEVEAHEERMVPRSAAGDLTHRRSGPQESRRRMDSESARGVGPVP